MGGFGSLDPTTTVTAAITFALLVYALSGEILATAAAVVVVLASAKPVGNERGTNPIYKLVALVFLSAMLASVFDTPVASHVIFIGIVLRAQPPKAPKEVVFNVLLHTSFVFWHAILLSAALATPCSIGLVRCPSFFTFCRWLGPFLHCSTVLMLPKATSGGPEDWTTAYIIPVFWDPPLLACIWLCHCVGSRFSRDGSSFSVGCFVLCFVASVSEVALCE